MTQERKSSVVMQGTLRDILVVIEKKIRNLDKRKTRLEQVEKDLEVGKDVSENQRAALSKKDQVLEVLGVCREFLQTGEQLVKNEEAVARTRAKKEQREAYQRTVDTLGKVMRLQFLLGEALRREESDDDNRALEALRQSVEEACAKDFTKAAEIWLNVLDAKPKEFAAGVTFEAVHSKLSSMGELLAKLNEVSLHSEGLENVVDYERGVFDPLANARGDSPLSAEGLTSDAKLTPNDVAETHQSEESFPVHVESTADQHQQLPLEQTSATLTPTNIQQQLQQQIHDQQMASTHHPVASPVPAVHHHHPAAVIDHQSGHSAPHAAVHHAGAGHGHHHTTAPHGGGGVMAVIPGMSLVTVSPVQQLQPLKEDTAGDNTIQFGSVDNAVAVQSQQQQHTQTPHDANGTPCVAATKVAAAGPVDTAADLDSMFGDREFDFFQDDQLPSTSSGTHPCTASSPANYYDRKMYIDENVQMDSDKVAKPVADNNIKLFMQILAAGADERQQQNGTAERPGVDSSNRARIADQHRQQPGCNVRDNRRSPRDSRGDYNPHNPHHHNHHHHPQQQQHDQGQPQQTLLHSSSSNNNNNKGSNNSNNGANNGYYRGPGAGVGGGNRGNRGGPKGGHYGGDSSGRNNWSDNRRGGDGSSNTNSRGGNPSWNNRNGRPGYSNGPRHQQQQQQQQQHHGGGGGGSGNNNGSGYGNRNGGVMTGAV